MFVLFFKFLSWRPISKLTKIIERNSKTFKQGHCIKIIYVPNLKLIFKIFLLLGGSSEYYYSDESKVMQYFGMCIIFLCVYHSNKTVQAIVDALLCCALYLSMYDLKAAQRNVRQVSVECPTKLASVAQSYF